MPEFLAAFLTPASTMAFSAPSVADTVAVKVLSIGAALNAVLLPVSEDTPPREELPAVHPNTILEDGRGLGVDATAAVSTWTVQPLTFADGWLTVTEV